MRGHFDRSGSSVLSAFKGNEELTAVDVAQRLNRSYPPYATLFRLEYYGKLTSRFLDGPKPRKRVYRVASI